LAQVIKQPWGFLIEKTCREIFSGLEVTNTQLNGICEYCILGKMDEKPFEGRKDRDPLILGTLHVDLMGPMNPEAKWSHTRFSLVINVIAQGLASCLKNTKMTLSRQLWTSIRQ